jgi:Icc-related predicted phosphoesterase
MRILAFADIHGRLDNLDRMEPQVASADLVLLLGDITHFRGPKEAARVLDRIRSLNPHVLAVSGNVDRPEVERFLDEEGVGLNGRGVVIGSVGIFGLGGSNLTPLGTPNEFKDPDLMPLLERGYGQVRGARHKILACHVPPRGTRVDRIFIGLHVGSRSVRAFIEKTGPDLCLCGHIHESPGEDSLGSTVVLNPGPFFKGGYALVEIDEKGVRARLARA